MLTTALFLAASLVTGSGTGTVRLATTTSVENSGLLAAILPVFEKASGLRVLVMPVGSGRALELARRGDVEAVFTHSPEAELELVEEGVGQGYRHIMQNWFLVVGPESDPAEIRGLSGVEAFRRLAKADARFASRGDESGTHARERAVWKTAGVSPPATGHFETGQGMAATLVIAHEREAYALVDQGTFAFIADRTDLVALTPASGDELLNVYSAMWVADEERSEKRRHAQAFVEWLSSEEGQGEIGNFRVKGTTVFQPLAQNE